MNRLVKKFVSLVLAVTASASVAACGAGSHSATLPQPLPTAAAAQYNGPLSDATLSITVPVPVPTTNSKTRRPAYVSSSTSQVVFTLNSASQLSAAQVTSVNTAQLGAKAVTLGSATCPGSGPWTCTITIRIPPGSDNITVQAEDASNNVLSQQIATFAVTAGGSAAGANAFSMTLDANAGAISLSGTQPCTAGSITTQFGSGNGSAPVPINVSFTDPDGKTINQPGAPQIQIQDSSAVWQSASGTISATGGTVSFTINQSAQIITLTPSTVPVSNASVNVRGVPPNSDGLSFTQSHSFTFSASTAPPAHNFLAVVEQNTAQTAGNIYFYTASLGGVGGPDSLVAYTNAASTTYLPSTNSINESKPDIDNPQDMTFDTGGNLLIANGGAGGSGGDYGNFACVPAGAIATGAALSTTIETNLKVPTAIAVSSNGTVAVANNPASATTNVQQFVLTTNYAAGTSLANSGAYGVPNSRPLVNLPTLAAGTFAVALYDGTNSKLDIFGPTGSTGTLTNTSDPHLNDPVGAAWDAYNSELVVVDSVAASGDFPSLNFYTVSTPPAAPVDVKTVQLPLDPDPADDCASGNPCAGTAGQYVAVAPTSGTIAVAESVSYNASVGGAETGGIEIALYDSSGNALSNGIIAYDGANTSTLACTATDGTVDFVYGTNGTFVSALTWLSPTKLLVLLKAPNKTAVQGIYIYDTSVRTATQQGFWGPYSPTTHACVASAVPNGPTQTYFLNIPTLLPFAASFKP